MKLIELLVKELPKRGGWPEKVTHIGQDYDRELMLYGRGNVRSGIIIDELAIDHRKCGDFGVKITREQYESALADSEGWIEWRGGEQPPVETGTMVDVKLRDGSIFLNKQSWSYGCINFVSFKIYFDSEAGHAFWVNKGYPMDIIAYRLHKPDINSLANDDRLEQDLNECIGQGVDMPEWMGGGLPPVGTICEAKVPRPITGWEWRKVKVVESGIPGAEKEALVYDLETTSPSWADEFRPLRTEAEKVREKLAASLHIAAGASPIELNGIGPLYFELADAIISGSVFGTTFKAGK